MHKGSSKNVVILTNKEFEAFTLMILCTKADLENGGEEHIKLKDEIELLYSRYLNGTLISNTNGLKD